MDVSDIALAATLHHGVGPCNCKQRTKDRKPHAACKKCHGTGKLTACLDCGGAGWKAAEAKICAKCEGRGHL